MQVQLQLGGRLPTGRALQHRLRQQQLSLVTTKEMRESRRRGCLARALRCRCWPDGAPPRFGADGRPVCADHAINPADGMKSFPSGHTSWSTSGLGFLSLWLMGKLRCFEGGRGDGPLRLVAALLPLAGAAWIGASRLQDYW